MAAHLALIDEELRRLVLREVPERVLVIRMPPRHGKSELVSHWLATWSMANWPQENVLFASYEATFAANWGRKARDSFNEVVRLAPDVLPGRPDPNRQAVSEWATAAGGYMATAGVGGPATGKGFHRGICDDLIKNAEQAQSEVYREKTWEWFTSTFWTRREPDGVLVVIGTPWHRDDYLARLRNWEEPIRELCLPAVCETSDDPLRREIGAALWPARFDAQALDGIRLAQGLYYWNALYQQRPSLHERAEWPDEYFNDIWYDHEPTQVLCKVMATDLAATSKDTGDYTAHVMLTVERGGLCYVDADIRRSDIVTTVDTGLALSRVFQPGAWALEINGFRGTEALIMERARGIMPPIATIHEHRDKDARIRLGLGPYLAYRKLKFKRGSPGARLLVEQLQDFPIGDFKDGPDALEKAIRVAREFEAGRAGPERLAEVVLT